MAPRIDVTSQAITRTGLTPALTAPTIDGDIVDVGDVALWVDVAAGGAACTVTVPSTVTQDGLTLGSLTVTVAVGTRKLIGPLPSRTFAQPGDALVGPGRALVNYSTVTGVTRAVVKL
jgi:hypothetical protein